MLTLLAKAWKGIQQIAAALVPFKRGTTLSPAMRWVVWILLDLALIVLLYFLNRWLGLERSVSRLPAWLADKQIVKEMFLAILGQLVIFIGIVLYWLYLLWFAPEEASPFPDIDEAWREAKYALEQSGIHLPRLPLFLVLGRPETTEENLFDAAGIKLVVKQTPVSPRAPVHVFANHDAAYVTCHDASVLGRLAAILALEEAPAATTAQNTEADINLDDLEKTRNPNDKLFQKIRELIRASAGKGFNRIDKRAYQRLELGKPLGSDFMADGKDVAWYKSRLAHLCRLIIRDRHPFCGANGILMLLPLAGTDIPEEAALTAQAAQEDLGVVRHEMKLDCPLVHLVVDMEDLPGFAEFMQRQPTKELGNRRGNGFPMATRLSREEVLDQVRASITWVATTYLQDSIYPVFQVETPTQKEPGVFFAENARLFVLLDEMNERADSLRLIIQQSIAPDNEPLFRYAGCYLAATGPKGNQAFVAGVFQKLVKEQSSVSWTQQALADDASARNWASYYLILSGMLFVAWMLLLAWSIYQRFFKS